MSQEIKDKFHSFDAFWRGFMSVFKVLPDYEELFRRETERLEDINSLINESFLDDLNNLRRDSLRVYEDIISGIQEHLHTQLAVVGEYDKNIIKKWEDFINCEKNQIVNAMEYSFKTPEFEMSQLESPFYPILKLKKAEKNERG